MGVITFVGSIPSLLLTPFAGVYIDRINKYKGLIIIQSIFMLEAAILAILTMTGIVQVWHIVVIGGLIGVTNAIDMPLRQSFVVKLVEDNDDLGNAISLNSSMFNLARMIGPAIAGVLIAAVGEGVCFMINSLSYIAVIGALFAMNIKYTPINNSEKINVFNEMKEGFLYAIKISAIKNALLFLAVSSFIGMGYQVLMPIFAEQTLGGNAQTLGFLMSISGIGALIGALKLASRKNHKGLQKSIQYAAILLSLALIGLSLTTKIWVASLLLFITGYGMVTIMASSNTAIQQSVDEDKRGRVMSLYTMAFIGTAPLGSLLEGAIANKIEVPETFLLNGIIMLIAAILFNIKTIKSYRENKQTEEMMTELESLQIAGK
jgi:MFS family permease